MVYHLENVEYFISHYQDDLDQNWLKLHRDMVLDKVESENIKAVNFEAIVVHLKGINAFSLMIPEVTTLICRMITCTT